MNGPGDPLARLRDIHLPEPVGWWPPAPGWWLLAGLVLGLLAWSARALYRRRRLGAYRREARRELEHAFAAAKDDIAYLQQVNRVLKRVALQSFPDQPVAAMSGPEWCEFLDNCWNGDPPGRFADSPLAGQLYAPAARTDREALQALAMRWVQRHRGAPC